MPMRATFLSCAMPCVVALLSVPALAQGQRTKEDADNFALEEVIVTATKREENLQNVPTAIAVLDASRLQNIGATSLTDVAKLVPGLEVVSVNAASNNYYSIRGATQSDFAEHQESPVAVYMDGVYLSQSSGTAALLFDAARVEVLRGPQGTLFGRNATAGLVHYISNPPARELSGYAQARFGDDNSRTLEAAINVPLSSALAVRLSLAGDFSEPWLRNTIAKDPYDTKSGAGRLQFSFKPEGPFEGTLNLHMVDDKVARAGFYKPTNVFPDPAHNGSASFVPPDTDIWGTCPGCDQFGYQEPGSYDYYTADNDLIGYLDNKVIGSTLTLKYAIAGLNLTSISDFTRFEKAYAEDTDGRPVLEGTYWTTIRTNQWSQELRLDNGSGERLRWVLGAYYLNIDGHYLFNAGFPGDFGIQNDYEVKSKSGAVFAQADFDILKNLTLTVGGRWSEERKYLDYSNSVLDGSVPGAQVDPFIPATVINRGTVGDAAKLAEDNWSARASLAYRFTADVMGYLSWNRGLKPGGFNTPFFAFSSPDLYRYNQEVLAATELGLKSELMGGKVRINTDVFYYDYNGYQAFNTIGFDNFLTNHQAQMYGGELEFAWRPTRALNLRSGLAALQTQVRNFRLPDGTLATRQTAHAPKLNVTGGGDYTWSLPAGGSLTASTDFNYKSTFFFDLENAPAARQGSLWLQSVSLKYTTPSAKLSVQGFVDNLFDKHYPVYVINFSEGGWGSFLPAKPRTFGVQLNYNMN